MQCLLLLGFLYHCEVENLFSVFSGANRTKYTVLSSGSVFLLVITFLFTIGSSDFAFTCILGIGGAFRQGRTGPLVGNLGPGHGLVGERACRDLKFRTHPLTILSGI